MKDSDPDPNTQRATLADIASVIESGPSCHVSKAAALSHALPNDLLLSNESSGTSDDGESESPIKTRGRGDLEHGEYERRREAYWAKILFCEVRARVGCAFCPNLWLSRGSSTMS